MAASFVHLDIYTGLSIEKKIKERNMELNLEILDDVFTIHRLSPGDKVPDQIYQSTFYTVTKTTEEISVVCSSSLDWRSDKRESGWSCMKLAGVLAFSSTGILAEISSVLATAKISIFALSTFDTDYILVKSQTLQAAKTALQQAGHVFKN